MKNFCIIFLLSIIISVTALGFSYGGRVDKINGEYLRIHIRADSNDPTAQAVKYLVRDDVVAYLTPVVANCESRLQAEEEIARRLPELETVANATLRKNGFTYGASARLTQEKFPTRVYGEYTLPEGTYSALVIELGSGVGNNWWCVVYPPLCFAAPSGQNVIYKSKIAQIIQNWKKNR
ncbi:MAG: stage II sporulation protein R [Clostridia bacterium]|nr:stage II sporulation protein R [Clostridia bacterium]